MQAWGLSPIQRRLSQKQSTTQDEDRVQHYQPNAQTVFYTVYYTAVRNTTKQTIRGKVKNRQVLIVPKTANHTK